MLLPEEGKISIAEPIGQYLSNAPEDWRDIRVRHLLTHTAGLPDLENGFQALRKGGARLNSTTTQLFDAAKNDPISFAP